MAEITKPTDLQKIWASAGAIVVPADDKIALGWVTEAPPHQTENYLNNKHDRALASLSQHGVFQWDNSTGYLANKSWVQGSNGSLYYAKQDNTNQNPVTDTTETYWNLVLSGTGVIHKSDTTTYSRAFLLNSTNAATGRAQLGSTSTGDAIFTAPTAGSARTSLGSTSTGDAVFTAVSSAAARSAIGVGSASDTAEGIVERATDAETITGVDDVRYLTPKKLRLGFSINLSAIGHIAFPTWMGGIIFQWGNNTVAADGNTLATLSTTFPTACLQAICGMGVVGDPLDQNDAPYCTPIGTTLRLYNPDTNQSSLIRWFAVGY